ncbi:MAG TPA: amidase [Streptosporangiales bacterium]
MTEPAELLTGRGLVELAALVRSREVSATDLVRASLDRIAATDDRLHAYVTVDAEGALATAAVLDAESARVGMRGPLHGIPIAVKDNIPTRGLRTTYNSRAYEHWVPDREPPTVRRLRAAGAVIVGKANLNEFGWSIPSDDDLVPPPRNPWNPAHRAVGSSSGSAVAVAAGTVVAALGTDGGGSTRLPASQMGLVGLKPTRGTESGTGGLVDEVSVVSVLARSAADAAAVYAAMTGAPADAAEPMTRLAVPRRQIAELPVEPEVAAAFEDSLRTLAETGVELVDVDVPHLSAARDANFVLITALSHADHRGDLRERESLLGESTRRYLRLGAALGAADYLDARGMAAAFGRELDAATAGCAGLVTPISTVVTTAAARRPGEHSRGLNASFTAPFNLTGRPAVSIPSHTSREGIPLGLQVAGRPGDEARLLDLAARYGAHTGRTGLVAPC